MKPFRAAVAMLGLALVLAGGQAGAAEKTPLAKLVVPRSGLGQLAQGQQVELISGEISNARAANDSFDPSDTADSLAKAGRISGYRLIYGDSGFAALRRGRGLIDVGTSLDYFQKPTQAGAYEARALRDLQRARGKNDGGVVLERFSFFAPRGLGPAAVGVRVVQRIGKKRIYNTYVDFQIDRLICEATIRSADATRFETRAVAIAQVLADRIIRYAQGKLSSAAVKLPRPLGMSQPRPGAPDLTSMVLQTKDVKPAYVVGQGYAPDDNAILSYFRQFQLNQRSGLILLRNSVALQRSRREAAGRMLILRSTFSGAEAATTLANLVLPGAKSPTLDRAPRGLGIGDESFAVSANFVAQTRHLRAVLIHVRRDRVVETVIVIGEPQALNESRVGRYGRALNATLKRAFTKKLAA